MFYQGAAILELLKPLTGAPTLPAFEVFSPHPLIEKLERFVTFEARDHLALKQITRHRRTVRADETLIHEGSRTSAVFVIVSGVAYRYKLLANGRRQILGFLFPGDLCDADYAVTSHCDYSVCVLTDVEVALVSINELKSTVVQHPLIARALQLAATSDGAILREWLINVGQRDALGRIAHLLCELTARLRCHQEGSIGCHISIPLTQVEVADSVGLTVVHVNRCLQRLRSEGVIDWHRRRIALLDIDRLRNMANFDDSYLTPQRIETDRRLCF